jgi:hypothetical protein
MPATRRTRRCTLCSETGHDRRTCPRYNVPRVQNNQVNEHCAICDSPTHDFWTCPMNMLYNIESQQLFVSEALPSPVVVPPATQSSKRIHWDKCAKCGTENTHTHCQTCGEKQVAPVPKNEEGVHECTICYTNLRELNKVTTKCGHHYCIDCFVAHFTSKQASSGDCPMCRAQLLEFDDKPAPPARRSNDSHLHLGVNLNHSIIEIIEDVHNELMNI